MQGQQRAEVARVGGVEGFEVFGANRRLAGDRPPRDYVGLHNLRPRSRHEVMHGLSDDLPVGFWVHGL